MSKKLTVFVAMSGGVDSSAAAAILKKQGYDVVGVFMKNWSQTPSAIRPRAHDREEAEGGQSFCKTEEDFRDMRSVCQHLNIPHYTFNFEKEYRKLVLEYFFAEYKAGRTPNPDVMCNKEIKFGLFFERALKLGADFVATGHHIRKQVSRLAGKQVSELAGKQVSRLAGQRAKRLTYPLTRLPAYQLLRGKDRVKDQTYFVYNLSQKQLAKCLFPIGEYTKPQIRVLAKRMKLPTADKKDSQGICFIGPVDVKKFLKNVIKTKPGQIVNLDGEILGEHEGAWFYTIGQRRIEGLSGQNVPLYVVSTDVKKNLVIVGPDSATYGAGVVLEDLHLIGGVSSIKYQVSSGRGNRTLDTRHLTLGAPRLTAKPRYGPDVYPGKLMKVTRNEKRETSGVPTIIPASSSCHSGSPPCHPELLFPELVEGSGSRRKNKQKQSSSPYSILHTQYLFIFDEPQRALTPGQSLVVYDEEICLGGGVIGEVMKNDE